MAWEKWPLQEWHSRRTHERTPSQPQCTALIPTLATRGCSQAPLSFSNSIADDRNDQLGEKKHFKTRAHALQRPLLSFTKNRLFNTPQTCNCFKNATIENLKNNFVCAPTLNSLVTASKLKIFCVEVNLIVLIFKVTGSYTALQKLFNKKLKMQIKTLNNFFTCCFM